MIRLQFLLSGIRTMTIQLLASLEHYNHNGHSTCAFSRELVSAVTRRLGVHMSIISLIPKFMILS